MAGSKCAYLSQKVLDHVLGGSTVSQPSTVYAVLSVAAFDPTATGSACDEVSAGDYARLAITNDSSNFSAATSDAPSEKHNLNDITWPAATSAWGTPLSIYLADASSAGNLLYGADISNAQAVNIGDVAKVVAGAFVFNED